MRSDLTNIGYKQKTSGVIYNRWMKNGMTDNRQMNNGVTDNVERMRAALHKTDTQRME